MNRKEFVKNAGLAAASLTVLPTATLFAGKRSADPKVKMAIIGVGLRGQNHLDLLLRRADVDVTAICDVDERSLKSSKELISKSGKKMPVVYTGDNYAWKKLLDTEKVDGIVIATPWEWHKPMIIGALEAG
ncbi:Gfo/Idh/MocA family oxidoreductase, partial [Agriterribacter sp.]|uniref:Gfo/Idh/MocA family protein n=1 Tax=Agriterribacter sp. TaxID=2821509 RepID=UPI002CE52ECF